MFSERDALSEKPGYPKEQFIMVKISIFSKKNSYLGVYFNQFFGHMDNYRRYLQCGTPQWCER